MKTNESTKEGLIAATQVVVFLFAAYGSFFKRIAPPDDTGVTYAVGLLSFLVLIVLLIVKAVGARRSILGRRAWLSAGIGSSCLVILFGLRYPKVLEAYTYGFPPEAPTERHIRAADDGLTDVAREWIRNHPLESGPGDLERKLPSDQIWTADSLRRSKSKLLVNYAGLILSVSTAVFCLLQATEKSGPKAGHPR